MRIQGVVFDMDGVMFDTERVVLDGWAYAAERSGIPLAEPLLLSLIGTNKAYTRRLLLDGLPGGTDVDRLMALESEYVQETLRIGGVPVKPGLYDLLAVLEAKNIRRAIATSSARAHVDRNLGSAGIPDTCFDAIVTGDCIRRSKPAPDIYLAAASALALAPQACLALEDSPLGIRSAFDAGLMPVMVPDLILPSSDVRPMLHALIRSLADVPALLAD